VISNCVINLSTDKAGGIGRDGFGCSGLAGASAYSDIVAEDGLSKEGRREGGFRSRV